MSGVLPIVSVDQYGEITWNPLGQHAGVADLQCGERNARSLGLRLKGIAFAKMFTCAVKRAVRTCELAGFGDPAENDHDLVQWDYSQHEGLRTHEIHERRPQWRLLCDRCPEGETPYLSRPRIRLGEREGQKIFHIRDRKLEHIGFDHHRPVPAIRLWNDVAYVEDRSALVVWRAGTWKCELEKTVLKHSRTT
jgi:hypothetical protein